jgi:hypothetical protein
VINLEQSDEDSTPRSDNRNWPVDGAWLDVPRPAQARDETLRGELETHLKLLQRQGTISVWQDRKITAGTEWKGQIDKNLESAQIIVLLVSADFIASDYCYDTEMKVALRRHEQQTAHIVPIILRKVDSWESAEFGKLQALPTGGKPVTLWADRDSAWADVTKGIREVAAEGRPQFVRQL